MDTEGHRLGRIDRVQNGVARVKPTSEGAVTMVARLANLTRERRFGFSDAVIEQVTEEEVVLKDPVPE